MDVAQPIWNFQAVLKKVILGIHNIIRPDVAQNSEELWRIQKGCNEPSHKTRLVNEAERIGGGLESRI